MKNIKKMILSFVLAIVLCFPVFLAVGCGEQKNEEQERSSATVANDVARAYKDYIALLVKENNDLVKERMDEEVTEDPTPEQEARQERIEYISQQIDDLNFGMTEALYPAIDMKFSKADTWYLNDRGVSIWSENANGYESYYYHSDFNEMGTYEYVSTISYIYEGNNLVRIESTDVYYSTFYQYTGEYYEEAEYVEPWEKQGIETISKTVFDVKTNTEYYFDIDAYVDSYASEYFNTAEDFIQKYSAGAIDISDLDKYDFYVEVVTKDETTYDVLKTLKTFKKQNIGFNNIAVRDVNIFDAEFDDDSEEIIDAKEEEFDKLVENEYTLLDNGFYIPNALENIDWKSTKKMLGKIVEIAEEYKEWLDNMPPQAMSIEGPDDYTDFEYDVNIDFDFLDLDLEDAINMFKAALASMDQDYIKETWEIQSDIEMANYKAFDLFYTPEPEEEEEVIYYISGILNFQGVDMEYENEEIKYLFTFDHGEVGYHLVVAFNENQEITGFDFWYFEWLH